MIDSDAVERVARAYATNMGRHPDALVATTHGRTTLPWERDGDPSWPMSAPFWQTLRLEAAQAIALHMAILEEAGRIPWPIVPTGTLVKVP